MISASILVLFYGAWLCFYSNADQRLLLNPVVLSAVIVLATVEHFWRRDRRLPIVDVGVLCALITLAYIAAPTFFFIMSGFQWTVLSDPRLVQMNPGPAEVAELLWSVTAYLTTFCLAYAVLRGPAMPGPDVPIAAETSAGWALFTILALATIYKVGIESYFQINLEPSNKELQANYGVSSQLPLFLAQITHNILGILRITMLGIVAFVFARKSRTLGFFLVMWLLAEGYWTVANMGSRTYYAFMIMAVVLSYHRIVKSIGPIPAIGVASALLAGLTGFGYWRDVGSHVTNVADIWSAATEFQVLLANGLHVSWAYAHGLINDVPWQIRLNDLILLIPQQLLPFEKLDMTDWYIRETGVDNHGLGLMFGVVAQSEVGFGIPEIMLRGALLGAVLAFIHRKCVKHATSLTAFIFYLWLCTSIYYTYRASTFYIATWAAYRVIPFVLLFWFFSRIFRPQTSSGLAPKQVT
jgi:hypothetical protein